MNKSDRIYVAGHTGLAGSALVRALEQQGYTNLILRTHAECDLTRREKVDALFAQEKPDVILVAAARVGGIMANNTLPADFIRDNLAIALNVIDAAHTHDVQELLFLSSSCVYPKHAPQPMREEHLLTGPLEPTNEPYAIAKIAGMKLCESYARQYGRRYLSVLPTNLYGPNDNFDLHTSHVLPALIRKFHDAKCSGAAVVELWGTGTPRREFMHADDLASACIFLMENYRDTAPVNIGVGEDLSIAELARLIADIVGFAGEIRFDHTHPDGAPQKLLDVSRLNSLGWKARISLEAGVRATYEWYVQNHT